MTNAEQRSRLRLATIPKMASMPEYRGIFTQASLRHLIFQAKSRLDSRGVMIHGNGLEEVGAIVRLGRKLLLDLDRFDDWLDSHRTSIASE